MVQDRTLDEDAEVFAAYLHRQGHINERDWATYSELYSSLRAELRPPDLMIYLRCQVKTLRKRYDRSPTLVLETDRMDYVTGLFHRQQLLETIGAALKG